MLETEIIEGNKLIAEFLELEQGYPHETDKWGYIQTLEGYEVPGKVNFNSHINDVDRHQFSIVDLEYYISWGWLMPVVEKIEKIKDTYHGHFGVHISSNSCIIQSTNFRSNKPIANPPYYFADYTLNSKIESTWYAVVEFIKWYNKNKQEIK